MSLNLRPQGKPCLRSLQGTLTVVAGVVALATAPAAIAQEQRPLAWFDAEAGVPASVDFADVAASGSTVVAVGRQVDEAAQIDRAVIYRWNGSEWAADEIAEAAPGSTLTDVAVAGTEAWAVGTQPDGAGGEEPLVRRLASGGWVAPAATLPDFVPTAVAIHGTTVVIGDAGEGNAGGKLHTFSADGVTAPTEEKPLAAGEITDVSLHGAGTGVAVARYKEALPAAAPLLGENSVRIYALTPDPALDYDARARTETVDMLGVASASGIAAVAFDDTKATWHSVGGSWVQDGALPAHELRGVAAVPELDSKNAVTNFVHETLVGSVPGDPAPVGAVWQRRRYKDHDDVWRAQALPAGTPALSGVAATGAESAWAVGEDGTLLRYWRKPPTAAELEAERLRLAAEEAERQRLAAEEAERQRLAAEEAERQRLAEEERLRQEELARQEQEAAQQEASAGAPAAEEPASPQPPPPPPAPPERDQFQMNGIVIDDGTAPQRNPPAGTRRLLKDVKAVRTGRRLIVSFRLTARARVALTAKRGRRVIAKTRMRTFRKGRRRLVLRFRGRPPSSLKVIVRRVSGGANAS